ncbi:VOC family protein [Elioraea sp.]|uniref:VOC family protein n=1 Tax=Elioraea sp. TaxID=2185103 RepID=UPI003F704701
MSAAGLDHVGIAGPDLDALGAAYERLGFRLTPRAQHHAPGPDLVVRPIGTGNRCAMLRQGYLELIAVIDPALPSNTLDRFLARYHGLHIIAFEIDDPEAELARLRGSGLTIPGIAWLERPIDAPGGAATARFARVPMPDAPEGRIQLIRHLTPELLWQPDLLDHPNHAVALEEVALVVVDPAESAARFARLVGVAATPLAEGLVLTLPRGRVRFTSADAYPGVATPSLPFIAGVTLGTDDAGAAIRRIAGAIGRETAGGFLVPPERAGGAALLFR